jgi:hypothetical protein
MVWIELGLMLINFPAHIIRQGFFENTGGFGRIHDDMVFKTIPAYILHKILEIVDLRHSPVAECIQGIVG